MAVQDSAVASDRLTECTRSVQTQKARSMETCLQEWLNTGRLRVRKVSTHDNLADLMTKAMIREKLNKFGRALNLRVSLFTDLSRPVQQ